jgi:two-component system, NarL family, response regulator NreC
MSSCSRAPRRIVLADDHVVVRQGIKAILENEGMLVVGEAPDGRTAIKLCESTLPDLAILDVSMPLLNGLDACREIRRSCPEISVLLLTMHPDESYVVAGVRAGISGYVLKHSAAVNLLEAIDCVTRGEMYLSPTVSRIVVNALLSNVNGVEELLSAREREVLQLTQHASHRRGAGDQRAHGRNTPHAHHGKAGHPRRSGSRALRDQKRVDQRIAPGRNRAGASRTEAAAFGRRLRLCSLLLLSSRGRELARGSR